MTDEPTGTEKQTVYVLPAEWDDRRAAQHIADDWGMLVEDVDIRECTSIGDQANLVRTWVVACVTGNLLVHRQRRQRFIVFP